MSEKNQKTTAAKEKPTPAYLLKNYPYRSFGESALNSGSLALSGKMYEIKCPNCKISIRANGKKIRDTYERLVKSGGCFGCGGEKLEIYEVEINK